MESDRRLRRHEKPNLRIAIVWAGLSVLFLMLGWQRIVAGEFPDPDDALRLVQVRDLLAGQGFWDLHQYRVDPSDGTLMHWSRLADLPIAALIVLLTPLFGAQMAETIAIVSVPLLTLGLVLLAVGRIAWRLLGLREAIFACLACGLLAPLVFQLQPMRIDHHGWQIAMAALALWAIAGRNAVRGGALAGIAMAAGITISLEMLPVAGAFGAVLLLRWIRDYHARWWLVAFMQSLALSLVMLFGAMRGLSDLVQHCDAVSPAHLGFFVVAALGTGMIALVPRVPTLALLGFFASAGLAGAGFFAISSPECLQSPFGSLDPVVYDYWYRNIAEGRPLWEQDLFVALPVLAQLLVALAATLALRARSRDWLATWWSDYAVLLSAMILLSLAVWRSAAFASVIAAVPLGWLTVQLLDRLRKADTTGSKLGVALAIFVILLPAGPVRLVQSMLPQEEAPVPVRQSECRITEQATKLAGLPKGTIFAPFDIGPAILLESDHAVVATSHHRAQGAMRDVIEAFTGSPDKAQRVIAAHGADYLALCTDLAEPRILAGANPEGLMAQLLAGEAPVWLEPVDIDAPESFRLWRVKPAAMPE